MANPELQSEEGISKYSEQANRMARNVEKKVATIPSQVFVWAAGASIVTSLVSRLVEAQQTSLNPFRPKAPLSTFFGLWAPTFLLLGVYSRLMKQDLGMREGDENDTEIDVPH